MRVVLDDVVYDVGREMFRKMLKIAKGSVKPLGVYAIEKNGTAIMLNRKAPNRKILNRQIDMYKEKGFKAYYNG